MTQANPSHPYTLASRSKSLPASQNLPKSMVAQTHGRKESTGIQHCIKAIAGEVVKLSSVHLINFGGGGQVIALKSATALILDRYIDPIDYVIFEGLNKSGTVSKIIFTDIKTGAARLKNNQKEIKSLIENKKVDFKIY
jgi:hypothetical protein